MERGYLGAGALCRACFEPFGRLEDRKAPYTIQCGHTICLSCLKEGGPYCRICGAGFDAHAFSRLCNLGINGPPQPLMYTDEQRGHWLQEAMSEVNATTGLHYMRHLCDKTSSFLDSRPESQFRSLSISSTLLKIVIESKFSAQINQIQLTHGLSNQIDTLNTENGFLRRQLEAMDDERKYLEDHIGDLMRRDPLMESEVVDFRREMNDLKDQVIELRRTHHADLFIPPLPENLSTPAIQIHPASRSPSPVTSSVPTDYGHRVETQYGTGNAINSFEPISTSSNALGVHLFEPVSVMPELSPSSASDSDGSPPPSPGFLISTSVHSDENSERGSDDSRSSTVSHRPHGTLHSLREEAIDALNETDEREPAHRPHEVYPGADQARLSSTVRFHIPEREEYPGEESFGITAPNSPAVTDADSMMTSSIRLLRTPEHEEQRTRFDLESRLTSPNSTNGAESLPYEDYLSAGISPSSTSPFLHMHGLLNEVNDIMSSPDAVLSGSQTFGSDSPKNLPPSSTSLRPQTTDNAPSRTRSRGGSMSTVSRALVRSKSTPTLRHSSPSSILSLPSNPDRFAVLTSNRRLARIATVLMEVLIHLMANSSIELDWGRIESSIHEGIREDEMRASSRRMLGTPPEVPVRLLPDETSRRARRSRSTSPEPPERCWTPS